MLMINDKSMVKGRIYEMLITYVTKLLPMITFILLGSIV